MRYACPRRLSSTLLVSTFLAVLAVPSPAQQPDTVELKPLVVTATRLPVPADAVPAAVTVITGEELRQRGIRTVAEALRLTSSATVVETGSYGGQTSLFLRGGESNFVKVLLDGVSLNQPGGAFDFADLTIDNVDRIEIVRGPVSVLYGSDAVTGVVHIITRNGAGRARGEVGFADDRSYGSTSLTGGVAGGAGALGYAVSASRFASDGLHAFNNDYRHAAVSGRARLKPDAATDFAVTLTYADNVFHYPTDFDGTLSDSNQFVAKRGPALALEAGRRLSSRLDVRLLVGWAATDTRNEDRQDGPADTTGYYASDGRDQLRRLGAGVRADFRVTPAAAVTGGVDVERETQHSTLELRGAFPTFADTSEFRRGNAAYYAQLVTGIGRPLAITVGARLEDNQRFGAHLTSRIGVAYRLDARTRIRASAGTGFKEPTFFENFARGFVRGNPDLDPERSRSWEAGLEHTLAGGRLVLSVTYFDQQFRDLIDFTFAPPPPDTVNYFNVAGAAADGVEVGLDATPAPGWQAGLHYAYLDTRVTDPGFDTGSTGAFAPGQQLLRRPPHTAGLGVSRRLGARGLATLGAQYVGEREDIDYRTFTRVTLRPYTRVDLGVELEVVGAGGSRPGLALTLRGENLLDHSYQEARHFPARGRLLLAGVRLRFGA